eukprot:TRINITY_DN9291_c0_g1_i2.p1 TRINITY_DN9291_c0_g1~~TRINITY_DN9291_c0_g1_i2.p1  ORF type:complete len:160 (-),score=28.98 TRINITY_DN9291_c0_g1_i2:154-594(-)
MRGILGTGANLSTYTYAREYVLRNGIMKDSPLTDLACAMPSGLATVLMINPVDVVRTRLYNQPGKASSSSPSSSTTKTAPPPPTTTPAAGGSIQRYNGMMDAFVKIFRDEGVRAFYKGSVSHFLRMGPHFALTFLFFEQMKRVASR